MSGSRVKTLVIAALVLINIFFLAVIVIDAINDAQSERKTIENVCAVLRAGGIRIEPSAIKADGSLRTMRTARGDEAEAAIVRAILGPTVMTVHGVRHQYENTGRGVAIFSSGGDFEIMVDPGAVAVSNGAVRTVQRLLRDMKLETSELIFTDLAERDTVTAICSYRRASIFNCTIEFIFSGDNLETVKGRYVTDIEPMEDGAMISHVGTALLCFLSAARDEEREDVACTRIDSIESGFQHHVVGAFGGGEIIPVWLIATDKGSYYVIYATGEILPVTQQIDARSTRIGQ